MADHVRETIMVAALAAITGLSTTGARVFRDRDTDERPMQSTELPGLVPTDDGDPSEVISLGNGRLLERRMRIAIAAHVKAASGYSTQLNQILKEIEFALSAAALGGAKWTTLVQVSTREVSEGGDTPALRQTFTFEFFYITAHDAPDVAL
jgi:hypothetical protein